MKVRLALLSLVLLLACDKDKEEVKPEDELWLYINRFYDEAKARDITINEPLVTVKFVEAAEIAPYSGYADVDPPRIRIVKTKWDTYTAIQKEILMYHEMGHAVLRRQHTNEMLPNCSSYKSMMMDGDQFVLYNNENSISRQYYLDELFDPYEPYPVWAGLVKTNQHIIFDRPQTGFQFGKNEPCTHTGFSDENLFRIVGTESWGGIAYYKIDIPTASIPVGATFTLTGQLKSDNVTGRGVGATIEADLDQSKYFWTTLRQYQGPLIGTRDWTPFKLTLNCYPSSKPDMFVYLYLLGDGTGDVSFKDIVISYYE